MKNKLSPWALSVEEDIDLSSDGLIDILDSDAPKVEVRQGRSSLWVVFAQARILVALRTCYSPGEIKIRKKGSGKFDVSSSTGNFVVDIKARENSVFNIVTKFTPNENLDLPFSPRDIYVLDRQSKKLSSNGSVLATQPTIGTGLVYFLADELPFLYVQNFSSLYEYFKLTEASAKDSVGGTFPEIGFSLPPTKKSLMAGKELIISDVYFTSGNKAAQSTVEYSKSFIKLLSRVYGILPKPSTEYVNWPVKAEDSLKDLSSVDECKFTTESDTYINAYVGTDNKPPESMVQLAVLNPMLEYSKWRGKEAELAEKLNANVANFWDGKAGSFVRWVKGIPFKGDKQGNEYNKTDSWYSYYILDQLALLAEKGNKQARDLFIKSLPNAVKVARHFNYDWPVFYDLYTLEVIDEGEYGENDVGGLYAHVMILAYELTQDQKYLDEAEKALDGISKYGFELLYQTHNTMIGALALVKLWKLTGKRKYLNLTNLFIANIFNYFWLWECNYGYAKDYNTFFGLLPLRGAPYTAPYEEAEVLRCLITSMKSNRHEIDQEINLLCSEYMKHLLSRARFYYPQYLPGEAIVEKPKEGKIMKQLTIPLEDLNEGWKQAGSVGQEVYGAGLAFVLTTVAYHKLQDVPFTIYCNYPVLEATVKENSNAESGSVNLVMPSGELLDYEIRLIADSLPINITVEKQDNSKSERLKGRNVSGGKSYMVKGAGNISIYW